MGCARELCSPKGLGRGWDFRRAEPVVRPPRPDESACGRGAAYNPLGNGRLSTPLAHRSTQLGWRKGRELMDAPTLVRRPLEQPFVAPGMESAQQRQLPRRATDLGKQAQQHRAAVSSSERKGLPVSDHVRQLLPKGLSLAGPRACVGGPGGELRQVTRGWRHLASARDAKVARLGRAGADMVLGL